MIDPHESPSDLNEALTLAPVAIKTDTEPTRHEAKSNPLPDIPGFYLESELGRGGMGVVYLARQEKLNRLVALKMIIGADHAGSETRQRFLAEAEAIAKLHHPGIVQVHEFGTHDGNPYFALEYLSGGSLDKKLAGTPLPPKEAADLVEKLARAVQSAHDAGIIHRDLKPANILIDDVVALPGSSPSQLRTQHPGLRTFSPKITDFGLVKNVGSEMTATGAILGTPSYMAPEQADGKKSVGPAVDIYALGAIFYECLTGRPPFKAATPLDTVLQVVNDEPVSIRQLQPRTPLDVETICMKCLQKDPAKRYNSAAELAEDLLRYLNGETIIARPVGATERAFKWVRRHPTATALFGVTITAAIVVILMTIQHNSQLNKALDEAIQQKQRAIEQEGIAVSRDKTSRKLLYSANMNQALSTWEGRKEGYYRRLKDYLGRCVPTAGEEDLRGFEWHYLNGAFHSQLKRTSSRVNAVLCIAASSDGRFLAVGDWEWGSTEGAIRLLDASTGALIWRVPTPLMVVALAFSSDGSQLACAKTPFSGHGEPLKSNALSIYHVADGSERMKLGPLKRPPALRYSSDGRELIVVDMAAEASNQSAWATLLRFDEDNGKLLARLEVTPTLAELPADATFVPTASAISPDGQSLALCGSIRRQEEGKELTTRGAVLLLHLKTGKHIRTLEGSTTPVTAALFTPNSQRLVTSCTNDTLHLWDLAGGRLLWSAEQRLGTLATLAVSPDGKMIAAAPGELVADELVLRDAITGTVQKTILAHTETVTGLAWVPHKNTLISVSPDTAVVWWDTRPVNLSEHFGREAVEPQALAVVDGGKTLVTATARFPDQKDRLTRRPSQGAERITGELQWWDIATQQRIATFEGTGAARCLAASPDGKQLAFVGENGKLRVWNAITRLEIAVPPELSGNLSSVAWSPQGNTLTVAGGHGGTTYWNTIAGAKGIYGPYGEPDKACTAVAWSPQGTMVATAVMDTSTNDAAAAGAAVFLWDMVKPGQLLGKLPAGMAQNARVLAFSPDGRFLATEGEFDVALWDVKLLTKLVTLKGHAGGIESLSFAPDGRTVVTSSWDGTVKLWDTELGIERFTFQRAGWSPRGASILPDAEKLAVVWGRMQGKLEMELTIYRVNRSTEP